MDPIPDPLILKKLEALGIEPWISGNVAKNADH
jgi:hypothetical protein